MNSITDFSPQAVIIDAGSFPTNEYALRWLQDCPRVVCCDGAADRYLASGRKPWRIVGDCDSISPRLRQECADILRRFPDQDTNDQTKAVRYLAAKGITRIAILGATGLREDHTLGNLSLLMHYLRQGIEARAYTDYGVFIPVRDTQQFRCETGTQVSIFNFGATGLKATGLRYQLSDFDSLWQGTLNETIAPTFTIEAQGKYLVFINYPG